MKYTQTMIKPAAEEKCTHCGESTITGGYFYGFCIRCARAAVDSVRREDAAREKA